MQYNSDSDNQDIVSDVKFLLGGIDTTSQYPLKDLTRNVNERFRVVWSWIFQVYGGWQFIDDNSSTAGTPVIYAQQNLTSGTSEYAQPAAAVSITGMEYQDAGGVWNRLIPTTQEEIRQVSAISEFLKTSGTPRYYILFGDVAKIFPAPNFSVTNGLRIFYDSDIAIFLSTDTTKVAGFASPFHRALSVGAALDFAMAKGMKDQIATLSVLWSDYEKRIKDHYSSRYKERFPHRFESRDLLDEYS